MPIPYANEIRSYHEQLKQYYAQPDINKPAEADKEFEEYLISQYSEAASFNDRGIERRSAFSYKSIKAIPFTLIFTALTTSIFILNDMDASSPRKTIDIKVENVNQISDAISKK
ncbi:MAG: hypothetical protein ACRC4V_08275 [Aeromonas veronii]